MNLPRPAVILAGPRTGGTFLSSCLSNHPGIFCTRGEPFHRGSRWGLVDNQADRLRIIWGQSHYQVAACKLMHNHAMRDDVWQCIADCQPMILYLTRENVVKQAVSVVINIAHRSGDAPSHPTHTVNLVHPSPVKLDPYSVFNWCRSLMRRREYWREKLVGTGLYVLPITYEQVTGDEEVTSIPESVARGICEFLGVDYEDLHSGLRKVHQGTMSETVSNWSQVVNFISRTDYARYCDELE